MYSDLDDFLADLDRRKLLARITEPVSPNLEIAAVTDRACKSPGGGPALLFEAPTGHDMPVASNVYGSYERMCLALGVKTLDDLAAEIEELMTPQMPAGIMDALKMLPMVGRLRDLVPKTVNDAACHEVVAREGTLDALPISKCWRAPISCSRATSNRGSGAAKDRSATTRACIRSPTTFQCSISPASRSENGRRI